MNLEIGQVEITPNGFVIRDENGEQLCSMSLDVACELAEMAKGAITREAIMTSKDSDLPKTITNLIDILGAPATADFVVACGGRRVSIPKKIRATTALVQLLGIDQARKLSAIYGGETIMLPKAAKKIMQMRNTRICRDYDNKMQVKSIAKKYGLTERGIFGILKKVW